jgi:hypothetical protein
MYRELLKLEATVEEEIITAIRGAHVTQEPSQIAREEATARTAADDSVGQSQ